MKYKRLIKTLKKSYKYEKEFFEKLTEKYVNFIISDSEYERKKISCLAKIETYRIILMKEGINPENDKLSKIEN